MDAYFSSKMIIQLFKKNYFLIIWGALLEFTFLLMVFLEKVSPLLLKKKTLIYSFFILSSLLFLVFSAIKYKKLNPSFKIIIFFALVFSFTLLWGSPLGPPDIYNYVYRAEVLTRFGQNPFLIAPNQFFFNSKAFGSGTIYGPLWMIFSVSLTKLADNNINLALILFKILAIIFYFGNLFLIYKILLILKSKYLKFGVLLYAWNPLILFEAINEGHNDIAMIFFVLLAIYFLLKNHKNLVLPVLTLSILLKYITILLLPLFFIFLIKKTPQLREKIKFGLSQLFIICAIAIVLFLPFWQGQATLSGFRLQVASISIYHLSVFPYLISLFSRNVFLIRYISYISFILIYFAIIFYGFKKINGEQKLIKASFWILASYLFFTSLWFQVWYLVWLIPLGIIIGERKYFTGIIFLSVFGIIHQGYNLFFLIQSFFKSSFLDYKGY